MKVLLSNVQKLDDEQLKKIEDLGYTVTEWENYESRDPKDLLDYDALISNSRLRNKDIDDLKNLKMIQLLSAGFDNVPLKDIKERGIKIANAKGVYSIPIAEHTILKILEIYRESRFFEKSQKNKEWNRDKDLKELYGKTIGIIGTGSIATEIAIRANAFGCKVLGMNTSGEEVEHFHKVYESQDLNTLLEESHIVVSTVPLNPNTKDLINKGNLSYMKDDGILINISRGGIVNEEDLFHHLEAGKLMGAALDVFENEPLAKDSPLWDHPRMYVTPHNSFNSDNINERRFQLVYDNLKLFKEGKEIKNQI